MNSKNLIVLGVVLIILGLAVSFKSRQGPAPEPKPHPFAVRSIDTMKYSRDLAREKLTDKEFDTEIDGQVRQIVETGATHVAVATPYDDEFLPYLRRWVSVARRYKLNVWFRGNMSGWENWFDYPKIGREEHTKKTVDFITKNSDLFENGDIFVSCPECENGGPGDPRKTGDVQGHRQFLTSEKQAVDQAFSSIGKKAITGYYSMNGDVARLVMDKPTTKALGGVVTIDHYVATPEILISDIESLHNESGGRIMLGEFGAPIPDIHGDLTQEQQAEWIDRSLAYLIKIPYVEGVNYWTNKASSTELWNEDGTERKAVPIVTKYFKNEAN